MFPDHVVFTVAVPANHLLSPEEGEYIGKTAYREDVNSCQLRFVGVLFRTYDASEAFALFLEKYGKKEIVFILGGPYGLDNTVKKSADFCLSLSPMTLVHGMARMFLLEQIYRACTLLRGEPYHK